MKTAARSILVFSLVVGLSSAVGAALLLPSFNADPEIVGAAIGLLAVSGLGAIARVGHRRPGVRGTALAKLTPITAPVPLRSAHDSGPSDTRLAA